MLNWQDPLRRAGTGAAVALTLATAACSTASGRAAPVVDPPVGGLETTLQDDVRNVPGRRIAWSTFWTLCWDAYPGAVGYEVKSVTVEGSSPQLERQEGRCVRVEAAQGRNRKSAGLKERDVLLSLQAARLAYRVRAVLDDDRTSRWSKRAPVGATLGTA